ncbi:hypothetical protein ACIBSR_10020 [Streptomyces sp. NPDC049936]|uniref:hypothetical protein n=1 Tax=Streptomyces sp. NPDC049936 TaxID=3365599 RepID=UPI0037AE4035
MTGQDMRRIVVVPGGGRVVLGSHRFVRADTASLEIAPVFVGICGTDLDIIAGTRNDEAAVLGHEAVVRILSCPSTGCPVNTAEALCLINPVNPEDQDQIIGHSDEGMLQEVVRIPRPRAWEGLVVPVRPGLDLLLATLSEPLGVALYGIELLSDSRLPERLLVVGAGPMGLLTAVAAQLLGVREVGLVDRSGRRIRYATESGLVPHHLASTAYSGVLIQAFAPDAVALCVGREHRQGALNEAVRVAASGARIDLVTGFQPGETLRGLPGVDLHGVRRANTCGRPRPGDAATATTPQGKPLSLTGHRGTSQRHLEDAMRLLLEHPSTFRRIITDVVSLDEAPDVITSLVAARGEPDTAPYRKLVVAMGS